MPGFVSEGKDGVISDDALYVVVEVVRIPFFMMVGMRHEYTYLHNLISREEILVPAYRRLASLCPRLAQCSPGLFLEEG